MSNAPVTARGEARRRPTGPAVAAPPPLRVVGRGPRHRRSRRRAVPVIAAVVVAVCLFALVAAHVVLAQGQFRLQRIEGGADRARARYERLRLEVAELEAPGRVVAAAQERLGMVPAPGVTYLSPSGPAAVPPATAARRAGATGRETAAATPGDAGTDGWTTVKRQLGAAP